MRSSRIALAEHQFGAGRPTRVLFGGLLLLLLLLLAFLQLDQIADDRRIRTQLAQATTAESAALRFLSLQQDVETSQRGYVLTGKQAFLEPFDEARSASGQSLAALRSAFSDDPAAIRRVAELDELRARKLAFATEMIGLRDKGEADAAARIIAEGEGQALMDRMKSIVRELIAERHTRLIELQRQAGATRQRMQLIGVGAQVALLFLLLGAFLAYVLQLRRALLLTREANDISARHQAIFEAASDALLVLSEDGRIEAANPAAETLFGRRLGELRNRSAAELFARRAWSPALKGLLHRSAARRESGALHKLRGLRADGTVFEAEVAISKVSLDDGIRFLMIVRDATERHRIDRLKSEFVATVSHELRTPLTSIAGSLGLVAGGATGELEPKAAKLINIALSNSQRLVRLINDILDVEKIESGKMAIRIRRLMLRPFVEDSIQANAGFAAENGVTVTLAPGGEHAIVKADPDRLAQVLTNLLSNAIKFSPQGGLVRVTTTPGTERHRVTVSDNGPGIPEEFQQNLFTRFAQADSSSSRSKGGTGLGLAIVKEILDRTGGAISYETSPAGTSFHVDLPAQAERRKRGVLLVQIDEQFADQIRKALRQRDIAVETVRDVSEIAAAGQRRRYDAVLLGLVRDGASAAELVQSVRAHPSLAATPILAAAPGEPGQFSPAVELVDWLSEPPTPVTFERGRQLLRTNGGSDDLHVLHVEDDEDVLRVVAAAFEGKATIAAARSADEARQALAAGAPDLVILDLALPGESGLELLPSLRRAGGEPIPVVIYTAHDEDAEIASRAVAMLTKSKASLDDLVATVLQVVQSPERVER